MKKYILERINLKNITITLLLNFVTGISFAVDRYVDPNIGIDNLTCDLLNPCQTLEHTINQTLNNDIVHLAAGTYFENPITISTNIVITGDSRLTTFIEPAVTPNRIFTINNSDVIIDKVTIQNGDVYDVNTGTFENGGAILFNSGNLVLRYVTLLNNEALAGGAIENVSSGFLTILGSVLQDNWASALGGAINCNNCGDTYLLLSGLLDNTAGSIGGAMEITNSNLVSLLSYFSRNLANKAGAISATGGDIHLFNNQFADNTSTSLDGGAIFASGVNLNIQKSTFVRNDASNLSNGAAITLFGGNWLGIVNSTFSANIAHFGGAIALIDNFAAGTVAQIHNSTFYGNTGNFDVNHITAGVASTVDLNNVIIAGGGNPFASECSLNGAVFGTNNLMDDANCGFAANPVTNLDTTLRYNGGFTQTHMLQAGSNAIDAGSLVACINPVTGAALQFDQRGFNFARPLGVSCDVGAVEIQ